MQLIWEEEGDGAYSAWYRGTLIWRMFNPFFGGWMYTVDRIPQPQMYETVEEVEEAAIAIIDSLPPHG